MKTSRNGKIARLPKTIRDQLNLRLDNNEPGPGLLTWLNTHPDVKPILTEQFASRPLNKQNLSEWRLGGYQDWVQLREKRQRALQIFEQAEAFDTDAGARKLSDAYATLAVAGFVEDSQAKLEKCTDLDQRLEIRGEILDRLSRLRLADYRAGHLQLRQDQRAHQAEAEKVATEKATDLETRRHMFTYFDLQSHLQDLARQHSGNPKAFDKAAFILELKHNLPIGFITESFLPPSAGRVTEPILGRAPNNDPSNPSNTPDSTPTNQPPASPSKMVGDAAGHRPRAADHGAFGVPPLGGGNQGTHADTLATSATSLKSETAKPSEPSPWGRGQGEGEPPLSEAANILPTNPPIQQSIHPANEPHKMPPVSPGQTASDRFVNPENPPRPTCQPTPPPTHERPPLS